MKKFIFIFIISFIFIFNVEAGTKFYIEKTFDDKVYINRGNTTYRGNLYLYKSSNNNYVYCIDPFSTIRVRTDYKEYNYNDKIFNLSNDKLNKINVIGHFGFNYKNHTDIKWYKVTQFLIWKTIGVDSMYFTNVNYDKEISELETLVNSYLLKPSFSNTKYEYDPNKSYRIKDLNNVLSNYKILNSNIDASIEGNELVINTKDNGEYEIKFIKEGLNKENYTLYYLEGSQPVIHPGKIDDIVFSVKIEVNSGEITLNKLDSEGINRKFASLKGAIYGLYKDDKLIHTLTTDENGVAYIKDVPLGNYYLKEITPSTGYELDTNTYEVRLTKDNKSFIVNSYENIIKGNILINKYYGNKDNYKKEDGATFEIYDINDNLIGTYVTKDGKINAKLDYGKYYVIQTKGMNGYSLSDKFNISINENKEYKFDLHDDVLVVEVPNTGKNDYYRIIPLILILFGSLLVLKSKKSITN